MGAAAAWCRASFLVVEVVVEVAVEVVEVVEVVECDIDQWVVHMWVWTQKCMDVRWG